MQDHPQHKNHQAAGLLKEVAAAFPELHWTTYKYIDEGWDHQVIILDDALVFRFPTDSEYQQKLQTEIEILAYLKDRVTIAIPDYTYVSPQRTWGGYQKIAGMQLSEERFTALPPSDQNEIAHQLAAFLSAIHTQDTTQPVFQKVSASYMAADQKEVKDRIETDLKHHISPEDLNVVTKIMREIDGLIQQRLPRVFIHNDVYSRHLLWDDTKGQLGIIDFSDMSLDDPAIDFAELHEYGFDFVASVYDQYTGPKDETFINRAWLYQKWIAVYMMTDHFENHKTSFNEARKTFDRVKRQMSELAALPNYAKLSVDK